MSEAPLVECVRMTDTHGKTHELALPGMGQLREEICKHIEQQKSAFITVVARGTEIGRLIHDYIKSAKISARVQGINDERARLKLGGAPLTEHGFVCGELAAGGVATKPWLEKCYRGYERAKALGFTTTNVNQLAMTGKLSDEYARNSVVDIEGAIPSPETLFPPLKNITPPTPEQMDADTLKRITWALKDYFTAADHVTPRIRTEDEMQALNTILNKWLGPAGYNILKNAPKKARNIKSLATARKGGVK